MSDGDQRRIPGAEQERFGRHIWHDPRNRDWPVRTVLPAIEAPRSKYWWRRHIFDQQGPSCTGQAAAGVLATSPFRLVSPHRTALTKYDTEEERHSLYLAAQHEDPWPGGEPNYYGSSTDAPFKIMRNAGHIREWRWCFGLQDVVDTLLLHGPVAIGVNWYGSMFRTDSQGRLQVDGSVEGGHAVELYGVDLDDREVAGVNSWGPSFGINGRFRLSFDNLDRLLGEQGEAVTIVI